MMAESQVDAPVLTTAVFGDVGAKIRQAVRDEVAERRRRHLPIVVDRGNGVEDLGD